MTAFLNSSLGSLAPPWRRLSSPGALASPLTLGRAQISTRSTALATDAATLAEYAADIPRFHGAARRLLIAGQRTNAIRNPRAEGVVPGTPGTLPTNWSLLGAGLTRSIVGTGIEDGIPYVDFSWTGTSASSSSFYVALDQSTQTFAASGETWTASVFCRLVGGSFAGLLGGVPYFSISERNSGGGFVITEDSSLATTTARLGSQRFSLTRTLSGGGSVARILSAIGMNVPIGNSADVTLRIGYPQLELAPFASTTILPALGAPAASTRGADLVSAALATLGIAGNGACTLLWSGVIPQQAPNGVEQVLLQLGDGTDSNRFRLRNVSGGPTIVAGRVLAGAASDATSLGSMTAGTPFRVGITIDGAGRVAGCFNGGAVQAVSGGPVSGLTTLRVGNNAAGTAALFGEVGWLGIRPYAVPDSALPGLLSTLPF